MFRGTAERRTSNCELRRGTVALSIVICHVKSAERLCISYHGFTSRTEKRRHPFRTAPPLPSILAGLRYFRDGENMRALRQDGVPDRTVELFRQGEDAVY